ncbi:MAG: hypothetical protein B9J98_00015 [Candidatus Terraquivivens tikiterensis]|uniref:Polymerase nucleotidyl transferase domain-containing protein n=1 Tax=Candidatus Terraquivivens tikiterensis TaxID=1980982 RepID=A0A2R7Y9R7_9ARCH|nr:MAG: hypothetical protein B9J98_00015 [Candidatus Terraquivivens tikiterensis]
MSSFCKDSLLVILFGSRARGEATPVSDYDLLAVKQEHIGDRLIIRWPAQIFAYSIDEVDKEIENLNTIVLDALVEGVLLCGDRLLFQKLRNKVDNVVKKRNLHKTKIGWVPVSNR